MITLTLIWRALVARIFGYLLMNCSLKKKERKNKTAEQTCTGLSLCIKVHNSGGFVAAPGELLGFRDSFKKKKKNWPNPQNSPLVVATVLAGSVPDSGRGERRLPPGCEGCFGSGACPIPSMQHRKQVFSSQQSLNNKTGTFSLSLSPDRKKTVQLCNV